jgi:hypothetical protein
MFTLFQRNAYAILHAQTRTYTILYVPLFNENIRKRNDSWVMRWVICRVLQDHMVLVDTEFIQRHP